MNSCCCDVAVAELLNQSVAKHNAVAIDMCDIYALNAHDFTEISQKYPGMWQVVRKGTQNP